MNYYTQYSHINQSSWLIYQLLLTKQLAHGRHYHIIQFLMQSFYINLSQSLHHTTTPHHCPSHLDIPQSNSPFAMQMRNWLLPCCPDNYKRERDNNEREYYAGLRWEREFRMNESNSLHNDLLLLEAPFVHRVSLTMPRGNIEQCRRAVAKIWKEDHLMFLRRCRYHLLQLAKEQAIATNK